MKKSAMILAAMIVAGAAGAQTATPDPATAGADAAAAASDSATPAPADAPTTEAGQGKTTPLGMDLTPTHMENGRWYNADDIPTYNLEADGTIDFATFSGFRRYSAECHVCHGPDGEGSTYAPALKDSVTKKMDYWAYQEIVASGKQEVNAAQNLVMPAFGTNRNVWCYVDDIYIYLLARGMDDLPRGRPAKRADKPEDYAAHEDSCMNG